MIDLIQAGLFYLASSPEHERWELQDIMFLTHSEGLVKSKFSATLKLKIQLDMEMGIFTTEVDLCWSRCTCCKPGSLPSLCSDGNSGWYLTGSNTMSATNSSVVLWWPMPHPLGEYGA